MASPAEGVRRTPRFKTISLPGAIPGEQKIVRTLVRRARQKVRRKPELSTATIDRQSVPTTQAGGRRGYDSGKRIKGRKRHIGADTNGLLLAVKVQPATCRTATVRCRC